MEATATMNFNFDLFFSFSLRGPVVYMGGYLPGSGFPFYNNDYILDLKLLLQIHFLPFREAQNAVNPTVTYYQ